MSDEVDNFLPIFRVWNGLLHQLNGIRYIQIRKINDTIDFADLTNLIVSESIAMQTDGI